MRFMGTQMNPCLDAALATPTQANLAIMRLSLVDWLSVGWAGRNEPVSRILRDMAKEEGGHPHASLFGGGQAPARMAALVNGTTSHALDYDDTHFAHIGHPSVTVIPAALALAEKTGATCDELLRACLAGCEASIRFGMLFGRGHYQIGFHQTATAGAFGATVASIQILKGDPPSIVQALALVSTRASGLKSQFGTMGKPYNAGIAASNGVECAQLALAGFTSSNAALNGPLGFLSTHHCDGDIPSDPGFLMDTVSHKYHACCHGLHATLEALATLQPIDATDVKHVEIKTHPRWMSVCNKPAPTTGLEAKFSFAAVVAACIAGYDTARLETFADNIWKSSELEELQKKVRVTALDSLSETQAVISVETSNGTHKASHDLAQLEDTPRRAQRVRAKSAALIGEARAERLWDVVHGTGKDVSELPTLLV